MCNDFDLLPQPSASDSAMEVLTFVFRLIEDNLNIEGGRNIMKVIKKCSESVRSMYYKDTLCREMFPISDEFIWPKESKLVELKASGNVVGHTDSQLIFILHSQVRVKGKHIMDSLKLLYKRLFH